MSSISRLAAAFGLGALLCLGPLASGFAQSQLAGETSKANSTSQFNDPEALTKQADGLTAQGSYAKAEPFYRKALDMRRAALGEVNRDTGRSYNALAVNLDDQGHYAEAEPLFRNALKIRRATLGEKTPDTGQSFRALRKIGLPWPAEIGFMVWVDAAVTKQAIGAPARC